MGATEKRMEQLGIRLQQTDWRGKGTVDAVLAGTCCTCRPTTP